MKWHKRHHRHTHRPHGTLQLPYISSKNTLFPLWVPLHTHVLMFSPSQRWYGVHILIWSEYQGSCQRWSDLFPWDATNKGTWVMKSLNNKQKRSRLQMREPHSADGLRGLNEQRFRLRTLGSTNWWNKYRFIYHSASELQTNKIELSWDLSYLALNVASSTTNYWSVHLWWLRTRLWWNLLEPWPEIQWLL